MTWSDAIQGFMLVGGQSYYQLVESSYAILTAANCNAEIIEITASGNTPPPLFGGNLLYDSVNNQHWFIGGQGYYTLYDHILSFQ